MLHPENELDRVTGLSLQAMNHLEDPVVAIEAFDSSNPSIRRITSINDWVSAVMDFRSQPALIDCSTLLAGSETASNPYPPHAPRS